MSYTFVFLLFAVIFASATSEEKVEDEYAQAFFDSVMKSGYDARVPPPGKNGVGSPILVNATLFILDVQKVDDLNMDFRATFYFRQKWRDPRLAYDHIKDAKFTTVYVKDPKQIWKPDLFFVEEKEGELHKLTVPNIFLKIYPSGTLLYSIRLSMAFSCNMDLRKFPFDTQHCHFSAESYGYTTKDIDLAWGDGSWNPVGFADDLTMLDFDLLDVTPIVESTTVNDRGYTRLQLNFTFQRKPGFFALRLFVPFALLVAVSWLTFWIRPKFISLRLTLLLAVLYLMVTIGNEINTYVSPAPYTKGSDVWIAVCEALVFGSLLEFILVSILAKKEKEGRKHRDNGDLVTGLDIEGKKDQVDKTESMSSSAKFVVKNLLRGSELSTRVDFIAKFVFPILFIFFNLVYWSVYCTKD